MQEKIMTTCTQLIEQSKRIVVLTGAGISTESGIKDFRSRTGIYSLAPERILSLDYFFDHPKEFYQFAMENLYHPDAEPNRGHKVLAKWEQEGQIAGIITQNIDGLHQKADSQKVIEFHGTMKTATCLNCGRKYSAEEMAAWLKERDDFYICHECRTIREEERYIKPDVVLFGDSGEWFTQEGFNTILDMIDQADCLLVLGSSLKVTPFSNFPQYRRPGVPMIIINKGTTPYDWDRNSYVIQESIGETLTKIDEGIEH